MQRAERDCLTKIMPHGGRRETAVNFIRREMCNTAFHAVNKNDFLIELLRHLKIIFSMGSAVGDFYCKLALGAKKYGKIDQ